MTRKYTCHNCSSQNLAIKEDIDIQLNRVETFLKCKECGTYRGIIESFNDWVVKK